MYSKADKKAVILAMLIVREIAAEDMLAYHQMMRMKFDDSTVVLQAIKADITALQVPTLKHKVLREAQL